MSSNKLIELEEKLAKLIEINHSAGVEEAFYIGVEIGRELERSGASSYANKYIEERRTERHRIDISQTKIERVESFLLMLVKESIKNYLSEQGSWCVEKHDFMRDYNIPMFDDLTVAKFNVQFVKADMTNYGGDFELNFKVTGELKQIFDRYKLHDEFTADLGNSSGEESECIYNEGNLDRFYCCQSYSLRCTNWTEKKHDEFYQEVTKPFMFLILSMQGMS
jgi:hypothetical protein